MRLSGWLHILKTISQAISTIDEEKEDRSHHLHFGFLAVLATGPSFTLYIANVFQVVLLSSSSVQSKTIDNFSSIPFNNFSVKSFSSHASENQNTNMVPEHNSLTA